MGLSSRALGLAYWIRLHLSKWRLEGLRSWGRKRSGLPARRPAAPLQARLEVGHYVVEFGALRRVVVPAPLQERLERPKVLGKTARPEALGNHLCDLQTGAWLFNGVAGKEASIELFLSRRVLSLWHKRSLKWRLWRSNHRIWDLLMHMSCF